MVPYWLHERQVYRMLRRFAVGERMCFQKPAVPEQTPMGARDLIPCAHALLAGVRFRCYVTQGWGQVRSSAPPTAVFETAELDSRRWVFVRRNYQRRPAAS